MISPIAVSCRRTADVSGSPSAAGVQLQSGPGGTRTHNIKEEPGELWTNQEEDDVTRFTFTAVPVKSEDDDEDKPQSSQMETEADGEDCGGPEPDRNPDPDRHSETEDCNSDCNKTKRPPFGENALTGSDGAASTVGRCLAVRLHHSDRERQGRAEP